MMRPKVLIVDDKPQNLVALEQVLAPLNVEIFKTTTGNDALIEAINRQFSLMILDVEMPEMDGFELARHLRSDVETSQVPIIFLSAAYSDFSHMFKAYKSGGVDYLVKPFNPDILREKVKIFLELETHRSNLEILVDQRTTMLKLANESLLFQKLFLESIIDSLTHPLFVINATDCSIELTNSSAKSWRYSPCLGWQDDERSGVAWKSSTNEVSYPPCIVDRVVTSGEMVNVEFVQEEEGKIRTFEIHGYPIMDKDGEVVKVIQSIFDVSDRKSIEEDQRTAAQVMANVMEGIFVTNSNLEVQMTNPAFTTITGYEEKDVIGRSIEDLYSSGTPHIFKEQLDYALANEGRWKGEIWIKHKQGTHIPMWLSLAEVCDQNGEVVRYVGAGQDISQIKQAEEDIRYRAYHDSLTGLPNRNLFRDRLEQALLRAKRSGKSVSILFMDLDHFKNLNDSHGHEIGDQLLKLVTDRFLSCVRANDTVARLGGDEFTVIMEGVREPLNDVIVVAEKFINVFDQSLEIGGVESYLGVSIGIATYPQDGKDIDTLIKNADTAMYMAKDMGRNNFQFFHPSMESRIVEKVSLETDLRKALEHSEFMVYYQPIYDIHENIMVGSEALVRWRRPGEGIVNPTRFIPIAEERGLIVNIDSWVLRKACFDTMRINNEGAPPFFVSVNLSARQFKEKYFVNQIDNVLTETGLNPELLVLEITETTLMDNIDLSIKTMKTLKAMGLKLSLDDFGTGYSSFNYLKHFPVDNLKLDSNFISDITHDKNAAKIARVMISLATDMGMKVIAEGVEEEEQLAFLKENGCQCVQGYLYSRPLPRNEFDSFIYDNYKMDLRRVDASF